MKKPELLAPAGDLEKLKIAVLYGADAVFVGSKEFSLRSRASNFTIEDLYEGAKFCHEHGAKLYVTTNIVPHNSDLIGLIDYLEDIENAGVDACPTKYPEIVRNGIDSSIVIKRIGAPAMLRNDIVLNRLRAWSALE